MYQRLCVIVACCVLLSMRMAGAAPIHLAATFGETADVAKILAADPTQISAIDESGRTPLFCAATNFQVETTKLLIAKGANVNFAVGKGGFHEGKTALLAIAGIQLSGADLRTKRLAMVKLLLEAGTDVRLKDKSGDTALHSAVLNHNDQNPELDVVTVLLTKTDVNIRDNDGQTALIRAASFNNMAMVKLLLSKGADINAKDAKGQTALHEAVGLYSSIDTNGKTTVGLRKPLIDLLVTNGAQIEEKDIKGATPIFFAASKEAFEALLAKGANINVKNNDGASVLHSAACQASMNNGEIVKLLLAKGLDANGKDAHGRTPLFYAVQLNIGQSFQPGINPAIQLLLNKGADLKYRDNDGNTLLHATAEVPFFFSGKAVEFLLKNGCAATIKNNVGLTPANVAAKNWSKAEINFLLGKGPFPKGEN